LKAYECWEVQNKLPKITTVNIKKVRELFVYSWIASPSNSIYWRSLDWKRMNDEAKDEKRER
jgi:uncharacterized protein with PIN domain